MPDIDQPLFTPNGCTDGTPRLLPERQPLCGMFGSVNVHQSLSILGTSVAIRGPPTSVHRQRDRAVTPWFDGTLLDTFTIRVTPIYGTSRWCTDPEPVQVSEVYCQACSLCPSTIP